MSQPRTDFLVRRDDLRRCEFVPAPQGDLLSGQALLKVDQFAFTANNVTYAVAGDMMAYWNFFPAADGWGRIPVWGFADVLSSRHDDLREGERVFGYLPMSTHLILQPDRITRGGFVDASEHRAALPPVYNNYTRTGGDPGYSAAHEDQQMLFRPLFMTAFLIDDFIADADFFGARQVILTSASSKTSLALAYLLHRNRRGAVEVIGLTSPGNAAFVEKLGCYDRVVAYDSVASITPSTPTVSVDMAGNTKVLAGLHRHFRDNLKHSCLVGLTHWEGRGEAADLPGPTPAFFFAPTQIQKRTADWGAAGLDQRYAAAWLPFLEFVAPHIRVAHDRGQAAVQRVYLETLEGRAHPDQGHILSLWT